MIFRALAVVPPMGCSSRSRMLMPPPFQRHVPVISVPIRLPTISVPLSLRSRTGCPTARPLPFAEIRLPAPLAVPPMVLPEALNSYTPSRCRRSRSP